MPPERRTLVRVRDLYKSFVRGSEEIRVLQKLTLDVPEGEFLALMGPSGSGKTTLLNLIAGLDTPTGGDIYVGDEHVSAMSESELARWRTRSVGFIFQFYHLLPVLTAYENVELPLLLLPLTKEQRRKQVMTALDLVDLRDRMNHRPAMLSGGQQQRVGIARAIVTDPTLIVADEPTGDLDTKIGRRGAEHHADPLLAIEQDDHHGDARSARGRAGVAGVAPGKGQAGRRRRPHERAGQASAGGGGVGFSPPLRCEEGVGGEVCACGRRPLPQPPLRNGEGEPAGDASIMPGMGFETSLVETGYALLVILLVLVVIAVIAGIVTLPIFYGALGVKVAWFWASRQSNRDRPSSAASPTRLRFGLPAFSLFATLLSLGYFGAFDWPGRLVGGLPQFKAGPIQAAGQRRLRQSHPPRRREGQTRLAAGCDDQLGPMPAARLRISSNSGSVNRRRCPTRSP